MTDRLSNGRRHHEQGTLAERRDLLLLGDEADVPDVRVVGHRHDRPAGEHEVDVGPRLLPELAEVGEEGHAALVLVDPAHVEDERPRQAVLRAEVDRRVGLGQVEPAADDGARHRPVPARVLDERLLLGRQVDDPARQREEGLHDLELDGRVLFGGGHQDRPVADGRAARGSCGSSGSNRRGSGRSGRGIGRPPSRAPARTARSPAPTPPPPPACATRGSRGSRARRTPGRCASASPGTGGRGCRSRSRCPAG